MIDKMSVAITLFKEKSTFFNNHPDFYNFVRDTFSKKVEEKTEIEIIIRNPQGKVTSSKIIVDSIDKKFMDSISEIF